MNNCYNKTNEENFKTALSILEQDLTNKELLDILQKGNIPQVQLATLKLENINSPSDAGILINNLTGKDGKIREATSFKIKEFMQNPVMLQFFKNKSYYEIFLEAIIDINGNICRNIINAMLNLRNDEDFCLFIGSRVADNILELLDKIEQFSFKDGKYKTNKEIFKLYWYLETISYFYKYIESDKLKLVIKRAKDIEEYTIREKIAKILTNDFPDVELINIRNQLKLDPNYYVRRF